LLPLPFTRYEITMLNKSNLKYLNTSDENTAIEANINEAEIEKFDALAESWWDPNGRYKTVLEFNRARVTFFIANICNHFDLDVNKLTPLKGVTIIDVGCGGGLVCEALAKAGANVVGIDVSEMSIEVAKRHALKSALPITYRHESVEKTSINDTNRYDVVINAEVIEHVPNQSELVNQCSQLCKPGGCVVMATLNRTVKSFLVGIVGAEYIMRYLPRGTHSWQDFVTPDELNSMANKANLKRIAQTGMSYSLLTKSWRKTADLSVNFIQLYQK